MENKNIYQKMSLISQEIGTVAKNLDVGTGKGSYKAVGEADVLRAVKPIEAKYGVYSYPLNRNVITNEVLEYLNGDNTVRKMFYYNVETVYRFINTDKPEEFIDIIGYGTGLDSGDKAWGKACTYSDKYCLLKAYKIQTGEDPDQEASEPIIANQQDKATEKQIGLINSYFNGVGRKFYSQFLDKYGPVEELDKKTASTIIDGIKKSREEVA